MSKYLKRLHDIKHWLKAEPIGISDILKRLDDQNRGISKRQLTRDFKAIQTMLDESEAISHFFKGGKKYFYIQKSSAPKFSAIVAHSSDIYFTNFSNQILTDAIQFNLDLIKKAITEQKQLVIKWLKDDETGDNEDLDTENVVVYPVRIICHRNSFYLACVNAKLKGVEVFGIRQLKNVELGKTFNNFYDLEKQIEKELKTRFGISKNIDKKIYNIEVKFTSVLGRFIENHKWHHSQKVKKINGNYHMYLTCGINRELMGWLFQWMYNVQVLKPKLLKKLYNITLKESEISNKSNNPLVHRNIFNENIENHL